MKIGINCGHTVSGQLGCGANGYLNESVETRNVGYALMDILRKSGHIVYDCTNDIASNTKSNLENICILANAQFLDLFVSIHFNAGGGQGCECYTYGAKQHSEAVRINKKLNELGFKDRGIKDGSNLYVVKNSKAKAILVEVCFVDTESDAKLYNDLGYNKIAEAIACGILGDVIVSKTVDKDLETVNDIVWELHNRGIISNKELWLEKLETDEDSYWLARKCANYIREKK